MERNSDVLYDLLRADGSIVINKNLASKLGLQAAIMYSELLAKENYFNKKGQLDDGWFFNTVENMEEDTFLSDYQQREAIGVLKELELIEYELRGAPPTRYFRIIRSDKLYEILISEKAKRAKAKLEKQKETGLRIKSKKIQELNPEKVEGNNTNAKNTKEDLLYIYSFWNKNNILIHKNIEPFESIIKLTLKKYSKEDISAAIENYAYILHDNNYFYSYKYTLNRFLTVTAKTNHIEEFLDLGIAKNNYKNWGTNKTPPNRIKPTEEELAQYDNIEEVYNQEGERIK